jgi:hypothetical protein
MRIDKRKVNDATRALKLRIGAEDCRKGNVKDPGGCAAARALLRMPGVTRARVHIARTYVEKNGEWTRYMTPNSLAREVVAFDRGGRTMFEPGEYILGAIPPTARADAMQKRYRTNKKRKKPTGRRVHLHHRTTKVRTWGANK